MTHLVGAAVTLSSAAAVAVVRQRGCEQALHPPCVPPPGRGVTLGARICTACQDRVCSRHPRVCRPVGGMCRRCLYLLLLFLVVFLLSPRVSSRLSSFFSRIAFRIMLFFSSPLRPAPCGGRSFAAPSDSVTDVSIHIVRSPARSCHSIFFVIFFSNRVKPLFSSSFFSSFSRDPGMVPCCR